MSDEPIRYGVVGLGRAGWDIHIAELRQRPDATIVAVADPLPDRRAEAKTQLSCAAHASLDDMLSQQGDIDVIVVATPSVCHGPDTKLALGAGYHVVVEKPMALSVAEADAMIRGAEEAGRHLFVHHNRRFSPLFSHLRDVVDSGIIGRLFHIRNHQAIFQRRNDWQTLSKNGGGVLNNTCPHHFDIILQLLGSPVVQVMGDLQQIASAGDVEDHVKAMLRAANGCTADMEVSTAENIDAAVPQWILCGTCGTLTSDGKMSTIRWFDPKQAPPVQSIDSAAAGRAYGGDDGLSWQQKRIEAVGPDLGSLYDNVTAVLREGAPMVVTPPSAREVIRVIAEIRAGTGC